MNAGELAKLEEFVSVDCIDHDPAPGQGPGPQGFRDMFTEMRTAFPDLQVDVRWGSSDQLGMLTQLGLVSP